AQAVQHPGTCRFADCRRHPSGCVVMMFNIHTLIVDEVFMSGNRHTEPIEATDQKPENTYDHHLHHPL
ncbi:MAG: hypothetical protein ABSC15_04645, partial [Terriglobales bacterium]